jgi:hypothetical protein
VLNRKLTGKDFDDAEKMITDMVLCAVAIPAANGKDSHAVV